jgi:hypothetical protein
MFRLHTFYGMFFQMAIRKKATSPSSLLKMVHNISCPSQVYKGKLNQKSIHSVHAVHKPLKTFIMYFSAQKEQFVQIPLYSGNLAMQ